MVDELPKLTDKERCAFGLGWEARRAGLRMESNPHKEGTWKWKSWREGFLSFKWPMMREEDCNGR